MPKSSRPKRTTLSVSLPPDMAARLSAESEARILAPSVLVERSLGLLFTSFDTPPLNPDPIDAPKKPEIAT